MNVRQENWITMFNTLSAVCQQNLAVIATVPAFQVAYLSFQNNLDLLRPIAKQQILQIQGFAIEKSELKDILAKRGGIIAATISAYANSINDEVLRREVAFSYSDLFKMRDILLVPTSDTFKELATTHAAALLNFGLTAAIVTDFETALANYIAAIAKPTNAINEKTISTEDLDVKINAINDLLRDQMDKNIQIFTYTDPLFYRRFNLARRIIDLHGPRGTNEGTIVGVVKDSVTLLIIEHAVIEIVETDIMVITDGTGAFSINIAPGNYTLRVTKDDYTEFEMPVTVVKGEEVSVEVLLEEMV